MGEISISQEFVWMFRVYFEHAKLVNSSLYFTTNQINMYILPPLHQVTGSWAGENLLYVAFNTTTLSHRTVTVSLQT